MPKPPKKKRRTPKSERRIVVTSHLREPPDLRALSRATIAHTIRQTKASTASKEIPPDKEIPSES